MFVFAPLLLGSHLLVGADSVPVFDIKKSCQGREIESVFAGRNADTCIQSEEAARDQLKKNWGEFSAKDKAQCVATAKIGGSPSYTDHLSRNEPRPAKTSRDLFRQARRGRSNRITSQETVVGKTSTCRSHIRHRKRR